MRYVSDHQKGKERKDAKAARSWASTCSGRCNGACTFIDRMPKCYKSAKPSRLAQASGVTQEMMNHHLDCVSLPICIICHTTVTGLRGLIPTYTGD